MHNGNYSIETSFALVLVSNFLLSAFLRSFFFCPKLQLKSFPTGTHLTSVFVFCWVDFGCLLSSCVPLPCSFPLEDHLYGFIMILIMYSELLFLLCVWWIAWWWFIYTSGISFFLFQKQKHNDRFSQVVYWLCFILYFSFIF